MAKVDWDASRKRITVTEFPDEPSLEALALQLVDLFTELHLSGDLRNLTKDDDTRLLIELRRRADAQAVLDEISRSLPPE